MNKQLQQTIRLWLWLMMLLLAPVGAAWAQVSFQPGSLTATQNFNSLNNSGSATFNQNATLLGIYGERTGTGNTVIANDGSSNAGNLYSYGTGTETDRAFGSVGSGNAAVGNFTYGYRLKNETGTTITSLRVQYTGEQWRNSAAAAQTVAFSYLVSDSPITTTTPGSALPTGYTAVSGLDFTSPITGGSAGAINGNLDANRTVKDVTIQVSIPNGSEVMLRWYDPDHTGADHGLSIDDLTVTATLAGPALPAVNLSVSTNAASEADPTAVTVTATVSSAVSGDQTVSLAVTGTGITADDYTLSNMTITIPDGALSGSVTFTVVDDAAVEGTETATLTISNPSSGITLGTTTFQNITITDNDAPPSPVVSIAATDATGAEAGQDQITFTVSRTGDVTNPLDVTYTVGGTATNGTDYTPTLTGTVTIPAAQSAVAITITPVDDNVSDASETVILTLVDGVPYDLGAPSSATATITDNDVIRIHDIQGAGHVSTLNGQQVIGVPGIVTVLRNNGFYMEDPNLDGNDNTSEGIFVFTSSAPGRQVGESVTVSGTVNEFRPGNDAENLSTTQIISPTVTVLSSGNPLPAPTVISASSGPGIRTIPNKVITNDFPQNGDVEQSVFDPAEDGIDFYESLEGMRVQINNPVTTGLLNTNNEIWVLADNGAGATGVNSRGSITVSGNDATDVNNAFGDNSDFNPESIQIDDVLAATNTLDNANSGTRLNTIVGVVDYAFGEYEILTTSALSIATSSALTKEATNLTGSANQLTVATFNVENLDPNDGAARFNALASAIVSNLQSPDIISLEEIQDNNGATNDAVVDASTTFQTLINAIASAGGPTYQFRQINPVDDTNGGEPGGNIRVGFLFNPNRVSFVDRPGGTSTASTTVTNVNGQPQLSFSPGLIDPTNSAFTSSRKPLAGEFVFNGQTVFVIGNHFTSRGGSDALYERIQPPTQGGQSARESQAAIVNQFVDNLLAVNSNANVAVVGDFNEFQFFPAMQILEGDVQGQTKVLNNLVETLPVNERFTYNFEGNAQAIDHILVSNGLFSKLDGFDVVHINSEFTDQLSDHDPLVARFNIVSPATPLALTLSASPDQILTTGTTTLSATVANGTTPYSFAFAGPGTITQSPTSNTASVSGLTAGVQTFTVTVTDATTPTSQTITGTVSVTVTEAPPANTAPTTTGIADQTATVGQPFSLNVASAFTDAETPNALTFTASGLPAELSLSNGVISGTPSTTVGSPFSVTVAATDPGSLSVSTQFTLTITPAPVSSGPFAITGVTTVNCFTITPNQRQIVFSPQYSGLNGQPVSFSVVNEFLPTTQPGPYSLNLYTDNPTIVLKATQQGTPTEASFTYNWLAACNNQGGSTNTAPTTTGIPSQTITVGQPFSLNVAPFFTDAETPGSLTFAATGLPDGLTLTGSTISGTPSTTGVSTVSVRATDPGNLFVETSFTLNVVNPISGGSFAITGVTTVNCFTITANRRQVVFTPQYSGLNGQPVSFSVVNEFLPTTQPGPYSLELYTDNPTIVLKATQQGTPTEASFTYNWLTACNNQGGSTNTAPTTSGIPSQTATVGQPFSLNVAPFFTDAETPGNLTFTLSGLPDNFVLSNGILSGTPSTTAGSPYTVTVTATDPGSLSVSSQFMLTVVNPGNGGGQFAITGVTTISCTPLSATQRRVTFTPQYSGLTGQPVSFSVVNEFLPTTQPGPYSLDLYTDNPTIVLKATQQGTPTEASFTYNWLTACNSQNARMAAPESAPLAVNVLGNPTSNESVEFEVRGATGQSLTLRVTNLQGQTQSETTVKAAASVEHHQLHLGRSSGMYLLQVSTPTQTKIVKVVRQ
ncbi:hypothetical protein BN8_01660 [Fibrisoma limi BUZ 3]|uniref:Uncharacterized protein n=1 Tax=Fibrisoma limi BUZ 3 TaxID=1185876 RepID=I2GFH1_9BACT|nr:putative Ig domain-containing protein [Fibrisoma limi]CCH52646.1 hypothetical protein BN8_01660 [Fibrisoma limi BUZ 3]